MADVYDLGGSNYGAGIDTSDHVVLFARQNPKWGDEDIQFVMTFPTPQAAAAALAEWGRLLYPLLPNDDDAF